MRNAQLKPGYNVQIGVDSEYIIAAGRFFVCFYEEQGKVPHNHQLLIIVGHPLCSILH